MKCPHCEYVDGWGWWSDDQGNEDYSEKIGNLGPFFTLPIKMQREGPFTIDHVQLVGCPSCKKTFIAC